MKTKRKAPPPLNIQCLECRLLLSAAPTTLYSFTAGADGQLPQAITVDSDGNLYGTTYASGTASDGTIWERANGTSTVSTLYSFTNGTDGASPRGITVDSSGNLYGTSALGGANGAGVVWELTNGSSTVSTLHAFTGGTEGQEPLDITLDGSGNLYGTTEFGGTHGYGIIWKLPIGSNTVSTLHSFTDGADGGYPVGIAIDSNGDLYGTTALGGTGGDGTIWELPSGSKTLSSLYTFTDNSGNPVYPNGITLDNTGDLYGTTTQDGDYFGGTVWELANGSSTVSTLYSFTGGFDGGDPYGITIDNNGNLFGTTEYGGADGQGALFELPTSQLIGQFTGSIPSTAAPGDTISPDLQITDAADAAAIVNGDETTQYYLSTTNDLSGIITPALATNEYQLNLNPGNSFTESQDVTIPDNVANGTYYLVAQIDANQTINPKDTAVFAASGAIQIGAPELSGAFSSTVPSSAQPGDTFEQGLQITDAGNAAPVVDGDETTVYFLSTTPDLSGIVTPALATSEYDLELNPGSTYTEGQAETIPDDLDPGTYYLVAQIDANQTINPNDTNVFAASGPIAIDLPDLTSTFTGSIPSTTNPGATISPGLRITDAADAAPVVDGDEATVYYLSTTPDLFGAMTPALATNEYGLNLNAGNSYTETQDVTIPNGIDAGTYYLVARIDANQTINSNDTNNFAASPGPITITGSDLSGSFTTQPPELAKPGDSGKITFDLTNADGVLEANGSYTVTFQLERGVPALGNGDIAAGSATGTIDLTGGDTSDPIVATINTPSDIAPGFYYLVATIKDSGGGITDANTSDKTFYSDLIQVYNSYIYNTTYIFSTDYLPQVNNEGGFTRDSSGDMYGTAPYGGAYGDGVIWELAKGSDTATTIYSFTLADGENPLGITVDGNGNLFGTTTGVEFDTNGTTGAADQFGTLWELAKGSSTLTTLYTFGQAPFENGTGVAPLGITIDSNGNLFGTTAYGLFINPFSPVNGGVYYDEGLGSIWELAKGSSTLTTLYSPIFDPNFNNAGHPFQEMYELTADSNGNLYGVNDGGGNYNDGSVWELAKESDTVTTLYSFTGGIDGKLPRGITIDGSGNLYGTTELGGVYNAGSVWELAKGSGALTTIFSFPGYQILNYVAGTGPYGIAISGGDLYGPSGGIGALDGVIFELGLPHQLTGQFTGSIPSGIDPGFQISLNLQITDAADADPIVNGVETTVYYLSNTDDLSGIITPELATNAYYLNLTPGASYTESQDVVIPDDTVPGTYYLVAKIDANQAINTDDTDDFAASGPIRIGTPDLAGDFSGIIPSTLEPGDTIAPALQLDNTTDDDTGSVLSGDETTVYYLSATPYLSGVFDPPLATNQYVLNLNPGDSLTESKTVTIPDDVAPGTYYLVAQIDANQKIDPNDTDNFAAGGPIQIVLPDIAAQFAGDIPSAAESGDIISPGLQIVDAPNAGPVVNRAETTVYYLSTTDNLSGVITPALATTNYQLNLNPGDAYTETQELTIPDGVAPGMYYLVAQIDANQTVEPNDADNYAATPDPIKIGGSDLSGKFTTQPPDTVSPGDSDDVAFHLTNAVGDEEADGPVTVTFQLEAGAPALGNGDIAAGTVTATIDLTGGETSDAIDATIDIPDHIDAGTYYIAATIDDGGGDITDTKTADKTFYSGPFSVGSSITLPITVTNMQINGDNPNSLFNVAGQPTAGAQRSMVEDIVYTFSAPVTIADANLAFTIVGTGTHAGVAPTLLSAAAVPGTNGTQWAVTLTGRAPGVLASIANGTYNITINPSFVLSAADGTTPLSAGRTDSFFRLYGDITGNGIVNNADLNAFKKAFTPIGGIYNPALDLNGDSFVNNGDLNQMKKDFLLNFFARLNN